MTSPADRLEQLLAAHGRMNFQLECSSAGLPARITMDDSNVYVATTAGPGHVLTTRFADVEVEDTGLNRVIRGRSDQQTVEVGFAGDADAARFLRVLRVRQEGTIAPRHSQTSRTSRPADRRVAHSTSASGLVDLRNLYRVWHDWALLASTLLLIVAWADLAVSIVVTLALWLRGDLAGMIWLLVAAAGFAMPFCLGALTRIVVYRFRLQDHTAAARAA